MKGPSSTPADNIDIVDTYDLKPLVEITGLNHQGPQDFLSSFLHQSQIVGVGTEADIHYSENPQFSSLCVKSQVRSTYRSAFSRGILEEMSRHHEACKILEQARLSTDLQIASVPIPVLAFESKDDNHHSILMEYINGKTIWRIFLEKIVEVSSDEELNGWKKEDLLSMDDSELGNSILRAFKLNELNSEREENLDRLM